MWNTLLLYPLKITAFETRTKPYLENTYWPVTLSERPRQMNPTYTGTQLQLFVLRIYLSSWYLFVPCKHLLYCSDGRIYSYTMGIRRNVRSEPTREYDSVPDKIYFLIHRQEHREEETRATQSNRPFDRKGLRALLVHWYHCRRKLVQNADPFVKLQFQPSSFKNYYQKLIVHPIIFTNPLGQDMSQGQFLSGV